MSHSLTHLEQASPGVSRGDQLFLSSQWMGLRSWDIHVPHCTLTHTHIHTHSHTHTQDSWEAPGELSFLILSTNKFAEGTVSFSWVGENIGTLGLLVPDPSTGWGTRKGLGFIRTGVDPLLRDAAFLMIRKHSRKFQGREKEKKLSPLSLLWRKQPRLLAERQPWGYSSCLQICDHKKSLSLWNTAIWEIIKRWPGGRAANLKDYAPSRPPAPDLPGSQLSRRRRPATPGTFIRLPWCRSICITPRLS